MLDAEDRKAIRHTLLQAYGADGLLLCVLRRKGEREMYAEIEVVLTEATLAFKEDLPALATAIAQALNVALGNAVTH